MTSTKFPIHLLPLAVPLAGSLHAATITSIATGEWDVAATWDSGAAAPVSGTQGTGDDFVVASTFTVTSNNTGSNSQALIGQSLTVQSGGVLDLARLHASTTQAVTWNLPPLTIQDGGELQFRASTGSSNHTLAANIGVSGTTTIDNTGGAFGQNIDLTGAFSGSGTVTYKTANSGSGTVSRVLALKSATSPFTGNWIVQHATSSSDDFGALRADAANALGSGTVTLGLRAQLINNAAGGIDSLTGITVQQATSTANLGAGWTNPAGVLTMDGGNVTLGSATTYGTASIASLVHNGGTLQYDIGGPAASDKLVLSGDYATTGGLIDIHLKGDPGADTYDLVSYGGTLTGTPAPLLITPTRLVPNFSNGYGSNDKVTVSFSGTTANLVWKGNDATSPNNWDTDTTPNFDNAGTPDKFLNIDSVTFDDSAASFTPALFGTVIPKAVTFNNSANAYTLGGGGSIGGTATLTKNGAANLTLTTANAFSGGTTLNAGKIRIGNNAALGTGTLAINGGMLSGNDGDTTANPVVNGTARTLANPVTIGASFTLGDSVNNGAVNFSGPVTLAANATVTMESGTEMSWSGIIGGSGNLEYNRAATSPVARLNLTNTGNTFDGDITVTSGRLRFPAGASGDGAFGDPANKIVLNGTPVANFNNNEGTASLQQTTGAAASIAATRDVVINSGKEGTFHTWGGQTMTVDAAITGGGILRKEDSGTLLLTGDNSYSGGTKITNGIVRVTSNTGLGSGDVTVGAVNNTLTARVDLEGVTVANNIVLNSLGLTGFFGPLTAAGGTLSTVNGDVTISSGVGNGGHLASNGAGSVLRVNGELIVLNGVIPNVRQGSVILAGGGSYPRLDQGQGELKIGADNGIAPGAQLRLAVSAAGTFDLNGFDQTLSQINRAATHDATVTNTAVEPSVLTLDGTIDHSFGGTLTEDPAGGGLSLVKKGTSTFTLAAASSYTGSTTVEGGTLRINATTGNSPITVASGATFGGTGGTPGTGGINGSIAVAGTLAPGNSVGLLYTNSTVTFGPGSTYAWEIGDWNGTTAGTGWDLIDAMDLAITASPANKLTIAISGTPTGFTETAKTFEIARSSTPVTGFDAAAIQIDSTGFFGTGTWSVQLNGNSIELVYAAGSGNPFTSWAATTGVPADPAIDTDGDGIANGIEFVIGGNPAPGAGSNSAALLPTITTDAQFLNFTYRRTDEAAGMPPLQQPYVQYGSDLGGWETAVAGEDGVTVSEVNGTPDLVTVKIPRALAGNGKLFARLRVDLE